MAYVYILDVVGTFAFAVYGAHKAIACKYDLFGIFACAFVAALGGGTIRELILNNSPVYLHNYVYVAAVVCGTIFAVAVHRYFVRLERYLSVLDAIGLATFAFIGANAAASAGLGLAAMVFFAVLTAAGGGIIADILTMQHPRVFYKDFYATPAMILAVGYWMLHTYMGQPLAVGLLIATTFALRITALALRSQSQIPHNRQKAVARRADETLIP